VTAGESGALPGEQLGLPVERFPGGPLGGDQQVGAAIAEGRGDWDPLESHTHNVDVKAPLRIAVVDKLPRSSSRAR